MSSTQDFDVKTQSDSTQSVVSSAAPAWEMPPRGDSYFQIRISRNTSIAIIFSLLVHLLLLMTLAPKLLNMGEPPQEGEQALVVQLSQPPAAKPNIAEPTPVEPEPTPAPTKPKPAPKTKAKPEIKPQAKPQRESPPDIMAVEKPTLNNLKVPPPRPTTPEPAAPTDMASYVKAQRERRLATQGYTERDAAEIHARDNPQSEDDKRNAIIKRNLQADGTNGIFQIREIRSRTAQFSFKGWKNDYSNARQELVDVEAGSDGDINRAIVKKMIAIIRRDYSGDFNWESQRLGRTVILSARLQDNDGLEDFLIKEFFGAGGLSAR